MTKRELERVSPCITELVNEIKLRHPSWGVNTLVTNSLSLDDVIILVNLDLRKEKDWWESPMCFALDFSPEQMERAKDELLEWERDFEERVNND